MSAVVIVSGGLDSTVLYHWAVDQWPVTGLHFRYGSRHDVAETKACRKVIPQFTDLVLDFRFQLKSALLGNGDIPDEDYSPESLASTVVPFRNGIMLAYAVALAESEGCDRVLYGAHSGDHIVYPDCRPEFVVAFNQAAQRGTDGRVSIIAPFADMSKSEIVAKGHGLKLDRLMADTWSCYKGGEIHCGICSTCRERKRAFIDAGVVDLTQYEVQ